MDALNRAQNNQTAAAAAAAAKTHSKRKSNRPESGSARDSEERHSSVAGAGTGPPPRGLKRTRDGEIEKVGTFSL